MADEAPPGLDQFIAGTSKRAPTSSGEPSPPGLEEFVAPEIQEEKYGTTGQQLLTGLEGAASAGTFGISTGIEGALGNALDIENLKPEAQRQRRETNPLSHGAGQITSLVGGSFVLPGAGAAGLMERASAGAASALGLGAVEGAAAKIGSAAVKGAVENMMFQSGDEVSKMLASDPHQSVGSAAADVGLSGLLGGAVGGGIGGTGALWDATFGKKTASALTDMANQTNHMVENGAFSSIPEDYFQKNMIKEASGMARANANDIAEAFNREGLKPTVGAISDDKLIQDMESNLSKRPTVAGHAIQKEYEEVFNHLNKNAEKVLRDATLKTEAQVGREIKTGLSEKLNAELKPIEEKYEALKPELQKIGIPQELKEQAIARVTGHELAQFGGEGASRASAISERLQKIQNLDQLKSYRTLINEQLNKAIRTGGGEELPILYEAKNAINSLREGSIEASSKLTGLADKDAEALSSRSIQDIKDTDKAYREYKNKLTSVGREAGIGKVGNARVLLDKFSNLSDESFATKVFDLGDINQLNYFKENFPKEFELARRYKLREIAEKSIDQAQGKNGQLSVGKLLRQIGDDKMNPEARELLFQGNHQKIQDLRTIFQAMPGNANPSGTAAALAHGNLGSIQGLVDNASDGVKYAILKNIDPLMKAAGTTDRKATRLAAMMFLRAGQTIEGGAFKTAVDGISKMLKGESALNKAASSVFKGGREVIPSKMFETKDVEKLDKKLKDLQVNVSPMFDVGSKLAHYMPDHGSALSETAMNAVNYLNSLRPKEDRAMPLDQKVSVSPMAKAQYERALSIAESPLQVLQDVKEGSVTPSDIITLRTLYPGLYERMGDKLNTAMMDHLSDDEPIPYKTKMGMSLFLGQPLDSTMTPAGLMAIQSTAMAQRQDQQQSMPQAQGKPKGSMKALDKYAQSSMTPDQARQAQKLKS